MVVLLPYTRPMVEASKAAILEFSKALLVIIKYEH